MTKTQSNGTLFDFLIRPGSFRDNSPVLDTQYLNKIILLSARSERYP